jgi:hypothetical protein
MSYWLDAVGGAKPSNNMAKAKVPARTKPAPIDGPLGSSIGFLSQDLLIGKAFPKTAASSHTTCGTHSVNGKGRGEGWESRRMHRSSMTVPKPRNFAGSLRSPERKKGKTRGHPGARADPPTETRCCRSVGRGQRHAQGTPSLITPEHGLNVLEVVNVCHESQRTGQAAS